MPQRTKELEKDDIIIHSSYESNSYDNVIEITLSIIGEILTAESLFNIKNYGIAYSISSGIYNYIPFNVSKNTVTLSITNSCILSAFIYNKDDITKEISNKYTWIYNINHGININDYVTSTKDNNIIDFSYTNSDNINILLKMYSYKVPTEYLDNVIPYTSYNPFDYNTTDNLLAPIYDTSTISCTAQSDEKREGVIRNMFISGSYDLDTEDYDDNYIQKLDVPTFSCGCPEINYTSDQVMYNKYGNIRYDTNNSFPCQSIDSFINNKIYLTINYNGFDYIEQFPATNIYSHEKYILELITYNDITNLKIKIKNDNTSLLDSIEDSTYVKIIPSDVNKYYPQSPLIDNTTLDGKVKITVHKLCKKLVYKVHADTTNFDTTSDYKFIDFNLNRNTILSIINDSTTHDVFIDCTSSIASIEAFCIYGIFDNTISRILYNTNYDIFPNLFINSSENLIQNLLYYFGESSITKQILNTNLSKLSIFYDNYLGKTEIRTIDNIPVNGTISYNLNNRNIAIDEEDVDFWELRTLCLNSYINPHFPPINDVYTKYSWGFSTIDLQVTNGNYLTLHDGLFNSTYLSSIDSNLIDAIGGSMFALGPFPILETGVYKISKKSIDLNSLSSVINNYDIFNIYSIIADTVKFTIDNIIFKLVYTNGSISYISLNSTTNYQSFIDSCISITSAKITNELNSISNFSTTKTFTDRVTSFDTSSIKTSAINSAEFAFGVLSNFTTFLDADEFISWVDDHSTLGSTASCNMLVLPKIEITSLNLIENDTTGTVNNKPRININSIISSNIFSNTLTGDTSISYSNIKSNLISIDTTNHFTGNILNIKSMLGSFENIVSLNSDYINRFVITVNDYNKKFSLKQKRLNTDTLYLEFVDYINAPYYINLKNTNLTTSPDAKYKPYFTNVTNGVVHSLTDPKLYNIYMNNLEFPINSNIYLPLLVTPADIVSGKFYNAATNCINFSVKIVPSLAEIEGGTTPKSIKNTTEKYYDNLLGSDELLKSISNSNYSDIILYKQLTTGQPSMPMVLPALSHYSYSDSYIYTIHIMTRGTGFSPANANYYLFYKILRGSSTLESGALYDATHTLLQNYITYESENTQRKHTYYGPYVYNGYYTVDTRIMIYACTTGNIDNVAYSLKFYDNGFYI